MSGPLEILEAIKAKKTVTVGDIARAIEDFAPKSLQESYDNAGLQIGNPSMAVTAALLCLDITEDILEEAIQRQCNLIITHHPLIFKGLKSITGQSPIERIAIKAICNNIAIYSAHTNLDSAWEGVSHEMAHLMHITDLKVLEPKDAEGTAGLGVIGNLRPTPKMEFLRTLKDTFGVKAVKYSVQSPQLVIKRVALCGGAGASLMPLAIREKADAIITGDVKYHDFTSYGLDILIADIGHYESELCARKIFSRIIREKYPDLVLYFPDSEQNPIGIV